MEADSTQDSSSPPLSGFAVPIRAPLTIDSDSEFCLSINGHNYSRTSSFNSSSSIDLSSYWDEHISVLEEQDDESFVAYPDEEIVVESSNVEQYSFTRAFVKYPDGNCVKESSSFDKNDIFKPFVKYPDEDCLKESSNLDKNVIVRPFVKYPDGDYVKESSNNDTNLICRPFVKCLCEESSSSDFGIKLGVPVAHLTSDCDSDIDLDSVDGFKWLVSGDGIVQKIGMAPKARIFSGDDEGDDELQVEGVFSGDDINGIEELKSVLAESIEDEGCRFECLNEVVELSESDALSVDLERIDAHIVSDSNNEIEIETISVKLLESDKLSCDLERIDAQNVSSSNNEVKIEIINVKLPESDELSFGETVDSQIVSDSNNETEVETELDELSLDSEKIDAHIVSSSENEIEIETISENKQEVMFDCYQNESRKQLSKKEETPVKMQTREKFLRFALSKQFTTKVNGKGEFDFHLTILVIGKTGAGKSATINSIFGETKTSTNAFNSGTSAIQEIIGKVDGIQLRVLDTPGLKCSPSERSSNLRNLKSIKRFSRKHPPNVVLYVDRLDTYTHDVNDLQLLTLITSSLGSSVWHNCIIALTHAASNPPDESSGRFVFQRCCFIQEQIVRLRGTNRHMVNPVWLFENNPSYQQDRSKLFKFSGMEGLTCFDRAKEDECESLDVIKGSVERKRAYFKDNSYRVQLVGNKHWSLACRLYS